MKLCNGSNLQNAHFKVTTFMHNILTNGEKTSISPSNIDATADKIQFSYDVIVAQGQNHPFRKLVVTRFL
jgi:maltose phosphorylase